MKSTTCTIAHNRKSLSFEFPASRRVSFGETFADAGYTGDVAALLAIADQMSEDEVDELMMSLSKRMVK